MKLQHLAIIFVIIMLPISMVVAYYVQSQVDTISLQTLYSNKLRTATHDAIKSFQLNTINNKYSTISDSKIRDIQASITSFYNSLGTELGATGYNEETLKEFMPAILYTMHDGYYIYSKYYNNTIDDYQYGLKPYIYYACRYKKGEGTDFVVNYTLDNTITIYGIVNNEYVTKSASVINPNLVTNIRAKSAEDEQIVYLEYSGVPIEREILKEQLITIDSENNVLKKEYEYVTYNNRKIYKDEAGYFWSSSNKKEYINDTTTLNFLKRSTQDGHLYSSSALEYYAEAYEFSKWINENLKDITQENAVDADGNKITDFAVNTAKEKIFLFDEKNDPLLSDSTFNENRISVIRKSIQSNLATAIANFGANYSYEFTMPIFTEEDWNKLVNNISVATFMQGIPVGSKYFNDYCIITNNKNKELVSKDSIYIITDDNNDQNVMNDNNEVHKASSADVIDKGKKVIGAYKNIDFERQTVSSDGNEIYFYPHANSQCYECMVNMGQTYNIDDVIQGKLKQYNKSTDTYEEISIDISELRKIYLTALARERYDLYKTNSYFGNIGKIDKIYSEGEKTQNITFNYTPNTWTNESVIVSAGSKVSGYTLQTSLDNINWETKTSNILNSNGTVYARLIDGEGTVSETNSIYISNIDKTKPVIESAITTTNTLTIQATDDLSGISGYAIKQTQEVPSEFTSCQNSPRLYTTINGIEQGKTYYVWVKDAAGNISEVKESTAGEVVVSKGNITFTHSKNTWTKENVVVTAQTNITGYTLQTSTDGKNWASVNQRTMIENGPVYARLIDVANQAKDIATTYVEVIDKLPPIVRNVEVTTNTIKFRATDELSGIVGYAVTEDRKEPDTYINCDTTKELNIEVGGKKQGKTYYIWLKDLVGNVSMPKKVTLGKISMLTKENTKFTYTPSGWTRGNVEVTVTTTVTGFILEVSKDGLNWEKGNKLTYTQNGIVYARLVDEDEQTTDYITDEVTNIDRAAPIVVIDFVDHNIAGNVITVNAKVTQNDEKSGVDISKCKWVLNKSSSKLGTNPDDYTTGTFTNKIQNMGLTITEEGTYYMHVLSFDKVGNVIEEISSPIEVIANRHIHTGDPVNGGGCYGKAIYHKHINSCYKKHSHTDSCYVNGEYGGYCYCPQHNGSFQGKGHCDWAVSQGYTVNYGWSKKLNCNRTIDIICGKTETTAERYELNCGKEETIEGYTVNYKKSY